jgi:hypothetical protein
LEVRWEWIEAHRFIARTARQRHVQKVAVRTTRRSRVEPSDGASWRVLIDTPEGAKEAIVLAKDIADVAENVVVTEREEVRIYPELLKLYGETMDKIAKFVGFDVDDPDTLQPVERKKANVRRPGNDQPSEPVVH